MATNLVAVKSTHLGSPAKISTISSNKGTAVTEPTQNTTEGGFLIEATDAQDFGYHENTKNKKTTMFVSILAVLGIIHIALIVLLIVACQCYVTRRRNNKKASPAAAGKYTAMSTNPNIAPTQDSSANGSQANTNTVDLWTEKKPTTAI
ncbi:hypothetical protein GCK32_008354 [Trichostrongylus colubriformis]|uniref:Uncharacterized protein n=1 Tax=Trichostrongylus colubriformis TaxID=6319 RepID=A0AAN8G3K2_TRICO